VSEGHDWGFFKWSAAGFLAAFGLLYAPLLIPAIVLIIHLVRRPGGEWPADLGLIAGVGVACLTVAGIQVLGDGGLSPIWWTLAGSALTVTPTFAFWWLRCRPAVRAS
jgi:hypothetical protein